MQAPCLKRSSNLFVHGLDDFVAGKRRKDDVALGRDVHDGIGDRDLVPPQFLQQPLALLFRSVPDEKRGLLLEVGRAVVGEIARHEVTHRAEPDPANMDLVLTTWCLGPRIGQIVRQTRLER